MSHAAAIQTENAKKTLAFIYGKDIAANVHDPDKRSFVKSKPKFVDPDIIYRFCYYCRIFLS